MLLQYVFLDTLKKHGILISDQTLRNWEQYGCISVPKRNGRRGGRTLYNELSLAEAWATYYMIDSITRTDIGLARKAENIVETNTGIRVDFSMEGAPEIIEEKLKRLHNRVSWYRWYHDGL